VDYVHQLQILSTEPKLEFLEQLHYLVLSPKQGCPQRQFSSECFEKLYLHDIPILIHIYIYLNKFTKIHTNPGWKDPWIRMYLGKSSIPSWLVQHVTSRLRRNKWLQVVTNAATWSVQARCLFRLEACQWDSKDLDLQDPVDFCFDFGCQSWLCSYSMQHRPGIVGLVPVEPALQLICPVCQLHMGMWVVSK